VDEVIGSENAGVVVAVGSGALEATGKGVQAMVGVTSACVPHATIVVEMHNNKNKYRCLSLLSIVRIIAIASDIPKLP
jgi:co-chaperonin GroES (HSP10)